MAGMTDDADDVDHHAGRSLGATNVVDGVHQGMHSLGDSVLSAAIGVVSRPIAGAKRAGVKGFVTGVGCGVMGLAFKPAVGVLDLAAKTMEGLAATTELHTAIVPTARYSRVFTADGVLRPYREEDIILARALAIGDSLHLGGTGEAGAPSDSGGGLDTHLDQSENEYQACLRQFGCSAGQLTVSYTLLTPARIIQTVPIQVLGFQRIDLDNLKIASSGPMLKSITDVRIGNATGLIHVRSTTNSLDRFDDQFESADAERLLFFYDKLCSLLRAESSGGHGHGHEHGHSHDHGHGHTHQANRPGQFVEKSGLVLTVNLKGAEHLSRADGSIVASARCEIRLCAADHLLGKISFADTATDLPVNSSGKDPKADEENGLRRVDFRQSAVFALQSTGARGGVQHVEFEVFNAGDVVGRCRLDLPSAPAATADFRWEYSHAVPLTGYCGEHEIGREDDHVDHIGMGAYLSVATGIRHRNFSWSKSAEISELAVSNENDTILGMPHGVFTVTVVECEELCPEEGEPDAYVCVALGDKPEKLSRWQHKTEVKSDELSPKFQKGVFQFASTAGKGLLHVQVMEKDVTSDDFLGELTVDLTGLYSHNNWHTKEDRFFPLVDPDNAVPLDARQGKIDSLLKKAGEQDSFYKAALQDRRLALQTIRFYQSAITAMETMLQNRAAKMAKKNKVSYSKKLQDATNRMAAIEAACGDWLQAAKAELAADNCEDQGLGRIRIKIIFTASAGGEHGAEILKAAASTGKPASKAKPKAKQTKKQLAAAVSGACSLQVEVLGCSGLIATENKFTQSDPYVQVAVGAKPMSNSGWKSRTSTKKKQLNPSWEGEATACFQFPATGNMSVTSGAVEHQLHFGVREADMGSDDDLGDISIDWVEALVDGWRQSKAGSDGGPVELDLELSDEFGNVDKKAVAARGNNPGSTDFGMLRVRLQLVGALAPVLTATLIQTSGMEDAGASS